MDEQEAVRASRSVIGGVVTAWGIGGVILLLADALVRLTPIALSALRGPLDTAHYIALCVWVPLMAYTEGYRGFHRRFAPRVVARAFHLGRAPSFIPAILAPLYCMSLFHAKPREQIAGWLLVMVIVALVVLLRLTPQPVRGIIDAGVVVGLGLGTVSLLVHAYRAVRDGPSPPTDLPAPRDRAPK